MSDPFNIGDYENDVGLDDEDKSSLYDRDVWLKMTKGQILRASLVYFHTVDVHAVQQAVKEAKKQGTKLSPDQIRTIQQKALEDRATALGKSVDQLTEVDKLCLDECKFKRMSYHYQPGMGMILSRLGMDGPDGDSVWKRLEAAKPAYTTLL